MLRRIEVIGGILVMCIGISGAAWAADAPAPVRYDGYQAVRVYVASWEEIALVHETGARLLSCFEGPGASDYLVSPEALAGLQDLGMPYKVLDPDVQKTIEAERARLAQAGPVDPRGRGWFDDYKNYDQIVAKLNALAADRPDLATVLDIGDSLEGRDIWAIRITGPGEDKPAVLFNGVQHAREWVAAMVPMYIADQLVYGYDNDPAIQSLVNRVVFYIVPVVNVDGYVYSWTTDRMWRKNRRDNPGSCDGVDINRNWGTGWGGGGSSGDPCDETYRGSAPFSEPETQVLRDFFLAHPEIVSTIDFHSYSELILSPYGYTSALPPDNDVFLELDEAMHDAIYAVHGHSYDYGPIYSTIYQASGGSADWCYDEAGLWAFSIELRPTSFWEGGFELPPEQIIPTCEENFAAVMFLADWSATPVVIGFPDGLPTRLVPDTPETVRVQITEIGAAHDPGTLRLYTRVGGSGPFDESNLTPLGDNLYEATLPGVACGQTLEYYFAGQTTAGQPFASPADAPASVYAVTAAPIVVLLDVNMDLNPGWSTQGLWAWGQPTGGGGEYGGPDPTSGYTGSKVYGYNLNGDYENNLPERHLTSGPIDCTGVSGVTLSFYRWLGVEQPAYDHAYLRVSHDGSTWHTIWENTGEVYDGQWVYQEFDLSAYADGEPTVYLRWTMGPTDIGWRYCGWNIDDVQVWAADPAGCPQSPGDLNCDGVVNAFDIDPFILALTDPAGYQQAYPDCPLELADVNQDGQVNAFDIDPFIGLLTG